MQDRSMGKEKMWRRIVRECEHPPSFIVAAVDDRTCQGEYGICKWDLPCWNCLRMKNKWSWRWGWRWYCSCLTKVDGSFAGDPDSSRFWRRGLISIMIGTLSAFTLPSPQ